MSILSSLNVILLNVKLKYRDSRYDTWSVTKNHMY